MKILSLKLWEGTENEKVYKSGKISLFLTKEALKIQKEALTMAKKAEGMDMSDINLAEDILEEACAISDKKVWLICEAFGNQFSADDLEKCLDGGEIDTTLSQLIGRVSGVIEKN